jgi:Arc/MetJ-type ribon-helix-helix transcriptional regulator
MLRVMPNPKSVEKIAVSLPAALLRDIERLRRETGETRSAFIRRSIELMLGRPEHAEISSDPRPRVNRSPSPVRATQVPRRTEEPLAFPRGRR